MNATNSEKRIAHFTDGSHWRPEHILRRELEMIRWTITRWSIPCVDDGGVFTLPIDFRPIDIGVIEVAHHTSIDDEAIAAPDSVESEDDAEDLQSPENEEA